MSKVISIGMRGQGLGKDKIIGRGESKKLRQTEASSTYIVNSPRNMRGVD